MSKFSWRRVDCHALRIFNKTGKVVQLIMRKGVITPGTYTPGNLFTHSDPTENNTNYSFMYIKAQLSEVDDQQPQELGRLRQVECLLTVPLLYVQYLQLAEYVDPFLDGSRFIKTSAIVDEGRLFASVKIKSQSVTNSAEISK